MSEEIKLIFCFSGPKDKKTDAMKQITKAAAEIGFDLEERHAVRPSVMISMFETEPPPLPMNMMTGPRSPANQLS